MANTPTQITEAVLDFCHTIRPDQQPEYVPISPVVGAKSGDCYGNVAKKIDASGGSILHGWAIWIEPGFFIEAEHHAVWVSTEGQKEDVSPQLRTDKTLFIPDPENSYNGTLIPNRRKALTEDPRMANWIRLAEEHDRLKIKNAVGDGYRITPTMQRIEMEMGQLHMSMGMPLDETDILEAMQGLEVREEKARGSLSPKERAEIRKKQRKRSKR